MDVILLTMKAFMAGAVCLLAMSMSSIGTECSRAECPDEETASDLYKKRFRGKAGAWFLEKQADGLLMLLEPWPKARILDVGGGHGQYTELLVQHGYDVTVLGSSPLADRQIRHLVDVGKCRYVVGSLLSLPVENRSFDVVISFRLLSHLRHWRDFIHEACRVSRHAVIVDIPTLKSSNILYPFLFWLKRATEGSLTRRFHVFKEHEVVSEFAAAGFKATGRLPQFFLPMALHRKLRSPAVSESFEGLFARMGLLKRFGSPVILRVESVT